MRQKSFLLSMVVFVGRGALKGTQEDKRTHQSPHPPPHPPTHPPLAQEALIKALKKRHNTDPLLNNSCGCLSFLAETTRPNSPAKHQTLMQS